MLKTMVNAWKILELRKKILFTVFIVILFRIGAAIPVPFLNIGAAGIIDPNAENFMNYLNMMTGDAFNYGTIFAMSITPYINASIIIQLLTQAIPYLERLAKEGEEGSKKMSAITRYTAVFLGIMQSTAYYFYLRNTRGQTGSNYLTPVDGVGWEIFQAFVIILCLSAGTALIMWLGEQVNEKGIGNGISIILFAGIVSRLPVMVTQMYSYLKSGGAKGQYYYLVPIAVITLLLSVAFIVWMDNSERRIPVQYAKRVVGRKMYGGQNTHIPLKVNMSGVLPVIFASSILSLPPTIQMFVSVTEGSGWYNFFKVFSTSHWAYGIMYFVMIIGFAYFYSSIQYNPIEMANNISRQGGAIPGIRTGRPTSDYITGILSRLTLVGALLLSVIALYPILFSQITTAIFTSSGAMNISLGGTSIIILVGVALETVKQLESQMMMRHYKGFLD